MSDDKTAKQEIEDLKRTLTNIAIQLLMFYLGFLIGRGPTP